MSGALAAHFFSFEIDSAHRPCQLIDRGNWFEILWQRILNICKGRKRISMNFMSKFLVVFSLVAAGFLVVHYSQISPTKAFHANNPVSFEDFRILFADNLDSFSRLGGLISQEQDFVYISQKELFRREQDGTIRKSSPPAEYTTLFSSLGIFSAKHDEIDGVPFVAFSTTLTPIVSNEMDGEFFQEKGFAFVESSNESRLKSNTPSFQRIERNWYVYTRFIESKPE